MQWQELCLSIKRGNRSLCTGGEGTPPSERKINDYIFSLLITPSKLMPSFFAQYPL
jgi:hypothetical protein